MDENFNINSNIAGRKESVDVRDPFADEWGGAAYVDDGFNLNLNKLLHLVPYSEVLVVSGPEGVGKSTLLHQFVIEAKKSWKVVHVRSNSVTTDEELMRQIVHGFGLPVAGADKVEDMLAEVGRYLQALGRSGRRAIVVIDDVNLLKDYVLVKVENILSDERSTNALSLVLGIDERVAVSRFNNFPVLLHKLAYTVKLEPFSEGGVAGYIHHRLAHSGNLSAESFFDDELIKQIYSGSGGLPAKVNELARNHLNGSGGGTPVRSRNLVRWGLVLVVVVIVMLVLLFQDRINQLFVESPQPREEVTEPAATTVDGRVDRGTVEGVAPSVPDGAGEAGVATEPSLSAGGSNLSEEQSSTASGAIGPSAGLMSKTPPTQTPAPESTTPPVEEVGEKGEKGWIESQNPRHYTIQLMALEDEAEVRQFVKKYNLQGQSEIFYISRKNNRLAALAYGSYSNLEAVDAAIKELPKEWRVKEPWIRTFASVVKDSKEAEKIH